MCICESDLGWCICICDCAKQNQNTNTSASTNANGYVCGPSRITPIPGQKVGVVCAIDRCICNCVQFLCATPKNTMTYVIALSLSHSFYLFFQFVCASSNPPSSSSSHTLSLTLPPIKAQKKTSFHFNFISFQPGPLSHSLSLPLAISVARSGGLQPINTSEREGSIFA